MVDRTELLLRVARVGEHLDPITKADPADVSDQDILDGLAQIQAAADLSTPLP